MNSDVVASFEGPRQRLVSWFNQMLARACPTCQQRRRHKGRRPRMLITSLGEVRLNGVYRDQLCAQGSFTRSMVELLCLPGVTQNGFARAADVSRKLLGVMLSPTTIGQLCHEAGRRCAASDPPASRPVCGTLVGSCDGTKVHTRQEGCVACVPVRRRPRPTHQRRGVGAC